MTESLQDFLDELAADLGAAALVEDDRHTLVAYSRHEEPVDVVREHTILARRASDPVLRFITAHGVSEATGALRLPANPDLGMLPRLCVPVRRGTTLLGYLWFVEDDGPLAPQAVKAAEDATRRIADELWERRAPREGLRDAALRALLTGQPVSPAEIGLLAEEGIDSDRRYQVLVIKGMRSGRCRSIVLHKALRDCLRILAAHTPVGVLMPRHAAVLVHSGPGSDCSTLVSPATLHALAAVASASKDLTIGLGCPSPSLEEISASHRRAVQAAECGQVFPELGAFVEWRRVGMYSQVTELASHPKQIAHLLPGLSTSEDDPEFTTLLDTAEAYLDLGCNAQASAALLTLHRTSLYYRIQRFEALTGVNLKDGLQRTAVHLALKAARYAARRPTPVPVETRHHTSA